MMKLCIIYSLLFLFCVGAAFGGDRILIPDDVYYHRFASSVTNLEATWINPAGLGQSKDIKVQYIGVLGIGGLNKKWGYNVVGDGIGIGYRSFDDFSGQKFDEYIFAYGGGLKRKFYWGLSYRYVKNGPTIYNKRHFWNIGFLIETSHIFSMAAVFSNLNRGRVNGERTDIEQLYSFSYKPSGDKITLSMEIALSTGQNLSKADYNYGIDLIPLRGLVLYGSIRDNNSYEIGFQVNLRKYFVGFQSQFDSYGRYRSAPLYIGYNTGLQHSLIP